MKAGRTATYAWLSSLPGPGAAYQEAVSTPALPARLTPSKHIWGLEYQELAPSFGSLAPKPRQQPGFRLQGGKESAVGIRRALPKATPGTAQPTRPGYNQGLMGANCF